MTPLKAAAAALALTVPLAMAGPAAAQVQGRPGSQMSQEQTAERLSRIENALRDLQGVVYSAEGEIRRPPVTGTGIGGMPADMGPSEMVPGVEQASLSVRLTAIEESMAQLTGQVEQLSYRLRQQEQKLNQLSARSDQPLMDDGMSGGYDDGGMMPVEPDYPIGGPVGDQPRPTGPTPLSEPTGGPVDLTRDEPAEEAMVELPDDPDAAYNIAYNAVLAADYDTAERTLEAFVVRFPDEPQTAEAKFLLGEVYLATGANGDAARVFLDHVGTYKDDPRSPEAYLKLGISFARLGRTEEACKVFRAGKSKFPNMPERMSRRYDNEKAAAGCQ
ncbi:tetratricopeptide repeat protein [Parvularcula sp. LCG005]|uniref:tetratricopeptide repeat protein n=1 Tax=Parvularcula sp. LCG005 TaxID=3078805 RepID=UPI002941DD60|nr:tetratricopeptide repeat protein [Parvularcula sp. LCG005]WOI54241.1 tetratricopeptide repeat protein [Parvularcula sp. LCG005]